MLKIIYGASFLTLVISMGMFSPSWAEQEAISTLDVSYHAQKVTVEYQNVTLSQVLLKVGEKVGFTLVDLGKEGELLPPTSFQHLEIDQLLDKLLRGKAYAISYLPSREGEDHNINTVFLLGPSGKPSLPVPSSSKAEQIARPHLTAEELEMQHEENVIRWKKFSDSLQALTEESIDKGDKNEEISWPQFSNEPVAQHQQNTDLLKSTLDSLNLEGKNQMRDYPELPPSSSPLPSDEEVQGVNALRNMLEKMTVHSASHPSK